MTIRSRALSLILLSISLIATGASAPVRPSAVAAGGDTCAAPTVIAALPFNDSGNTSSATNQMLFLNSTCAGLGAVARPGPDLIYSVTVYPGNSLTFQVTPGAGYDVDIYLLGTCGDGATCVRESDTGAEGVPETLGPVTLTPGTYSFYVDSIYTIDDTPGSGPYTLSVTGSLGVPNNTNFYTLTPCRIIDTRRQPPGEWGGPSLVAGATRVFTIAGQCNVPMTAKSVSVNVTVTEPTAPGYLILFPGGTPPVVSVINYRADQTRANNAIAPLSATGTVSVTDGQSSGTTHFILDVNGYFQ